MTSGISCGCIFQSREARGDWHDHYSGPEQQSVAESGDVLHHRAQPPGRNGRRELSARPTRETCSDSLESAPGIRISNSCSTSPSISMRSESAGFFPVFLKAGGVLTSDPQRQLSCGPGQGAYQGDTSPLGRSHATILRDRTRRSQHAREGCADRIPALRQALARGGAPWRIQGFGRPRHPGAGSRRHARRSRLSPARPGRGVRRREGDEGVQRRYRRLHEPLLLSYRDRLG